MKKIYTIALAIFAFGTLSAQTTSGQTSSKKQVMKTTKSAPMPMYKMTTKEATKKSKSPTTKIKAVENKKKVKTQSK
ncbi:MAG: hypothetical protein JKY53_00910 [Flavobacteriales bacterium]|nr:hypothetical protein [Flavobacteriales bacterium]